MRHICCKGHSVAAKNESILILHALSRHFSVPKPESARCYAKSAHQGAHLTMSHLAASGLRLGSTLQYSQLSPSWMSNKATWARARCLSSCRSRQRQRLNAMGLFICLFVCLFVGLSVCRQNAKTRFFSKLSNLELWSLLTTYRKSHMGFSKNPLLDS